MNYHRFILPVIAALLVLTRPVHAAPTAFQSAVIGDGPYLYYELGETSETTANDSSGHAFNGAYTGGYTLGQAGDSANGASDAAVLFNGSSGYVAAPGVVTNFGYAFYNSSYEFVFKTTSAASQYLMGEESATVAPDPGKLTAAVGLNQSSGGGTTANEFRIYIRDYTGNNNYGVGFINPTLFNGAYHHLVFTFAAGPPNTVTCYLDGQVQTANDTAITGTIAASAFTNAFNDIMYVAAEDARNALAAPFNGTLDEAAIYTNVLTSAQVTSHYKALAPPPVLTTTVSQGIGQDWTMAIWQTNGTGTAVSPVSGNTYECLPNGIAIGNDLNETIIRSPAAGGLSTFPGNSLTLNTNTEIRMKTVGSTLNFPGVNGSPGLILNGGLLDVGDSGGFTVSGVVQVASQSYLCPGNDDANAVDAARYINLTGQLTGAGNLVLFEGGTSNPMQISGGSNTFSGQWIVKCGWLQATATNSLGTNSITVDPDYVLASPPFDPSITNAQAGPAVFEVNYDLNSAGALTLTNGGQMRLHQNCFFSAVNIEGVSLSPGTYSYSQLNGTYPANFPAGGSGSITVQTYTAAPWIVIQPASQTVLAGPTAQLTVYATGTPPLYYQWQAGATNGGAYTNLTDGGQISGSGTATLTISGATLANTADYLVIITNSFGSITSSVASLVVVTQLPPAIVTQPLSQTLYTGLTAQFTVGVNGGSQPLSYQWQARPTSGGVYTNLTDGGQISGSATANLTISSLTLSNTANYIVIVTNSLGSATSSAATLTVLPPVNVSVNTTNKMATMPSQGLGVNFAVYDGYLIDPNLASMLKAAGITAVRMPGGSYSDAYDWENNSGNGIYIVANDTFNNMMNTDVLPMGAQGIVAVNYGSNTNNNGGGDTNVAAAWVGYVKTNFTGKVKYWEIGNEVGGNGYYGTNLDWEYDLHYPETNAATRVGQPALSPAAYGTNAIQFISAMKAQDNTIKCGVGFDTGNSTYNSQLLGVCGSVADFVIIHWYPNEPTANILAASTTIVSTIKSTMTQLTNSVGATKASQMQILVTETGADGTTGDAVSLFAADNYLTWLENGIVTVDYWYLHTDILENNQTPGHAYYGAMMAHLLANVGDTFLKTTSGNANLRIHATQRQDGKTGVMLVNLSPTSAIAAAVNISGVTLSNSGTEYQFGLTNYNGANDYPSWPVSTNTVSGLGNSFNIVVPAYTIIDLLIPPAVSNTPPVLAAISNQTANAGQTVAFTAIATDTNQPQPTLAFSLLSAPTNATLGQINNTNAVFNWRPLVTQAGTTNSISLAVTDNNMPPLSATQSFTVIVNPLTLPQFTNISAANGNFNLQVNGMAGPDYEVQSSTNLTQWSAAFITNSPVMPFIWTDTNTINVPAHFYRVIVGPPLP